MGGCCGGMTAFGGATEFQGHGTPHLHAEGHVVCLYQYSTLQEIAERLEKNMISKEDLAQFQAWFHKEDPPDDEEHAKFEHKVYEEWQSRFASKEHEGLTTVPAFLAEDGGAQATAI